MKLTGSPIQNPNDDVTPSETMLVSADSLSYCLSVVSNCSFLYKYFSAFKLSQVSQNYVYLLYIPFSVCLCDLVRIISFLPYMFILSNASPPKLVMFGP